MELKDFTKLYSVQKTLRFELKPIGKTQEVIQQKRLLTNDQRRAEAYKTVKKIIDEYHKSFIEERLGNFKLKLHDEQKHDSLEEFYFYYNLSSNDKMRQDNLTKVQAELRKQISDNFTQSDAYKRLFGKELIKEDLNEYIRTDHYRQYLCRVSNNTNLSDKDLEDIINDANNNINLFRDLTTYFSGFYENRKNMYVADEKCTSIAHRLINENLPKFIDNMATFGKIATSSIANEFDSLYNEMESYLNVSEIAELFQLDNFSSVMTQKQIDVYNSIIGGRVRDDGTKVQGLNEYINLYNQQQSDKSRRLPKLKPLFKQILSDRNAISWLPEEFENDNEMLTAIQSCCQELNNTLFSGDNSLKQLLCNLHDYDLQHIYLPNDLQLTEVAQRITGNWNSFNEAIQNELRTQNPRKKNEEIDHYNDRIKHLCKKIVSINIKQLNGYLEPGKSIEKYFASMGAVDNGQAQKNNLLTRFETAYLEANNLLNNPYSTGRSLSQDTDSVTKLKVLLDAIKDLQHFIKPLLGNGDECDKDAIFYGELTPMWECLDRVTGLYNMVRNRLIKKPYSDDNKIKLFFENNGSFLNGWVDSKTDKSDNGTQYGGYLFRKKNFIDEYDYFLGISSDTKLFRKDTPVSDNDISGFERMDYYQLKPQTFYGAGYKGDYQKENAAMTDAIRSFVENKGSANLKDAIQRDRATKNPQTNTPTGYLNFICSHEPALLKDLIHDNNYVKANDEIIQSIKNTLESMTRIPMAQQLSKQDFGQFKDAMDAVDNMLKGKMFNYFPVSQMEMNNAMNRTDKPLLLFQITNKDLSYAENFQKGLRKSRGKDNLHTMYFKALMSGEQDVLDIGIAEVFFRQREIIYEDKVWKGGHHQEILKDKFNYPIISKKRYACDKFQFHLSVKQNYKQSDKCDINPKVHELIKTNGIEHIIGIDRGERHLLYLTVIDLKGNIKEQCSLNQIINDYNGKTFITNYQELLADREKKRDEARHSWMSIEDIKDLKEGYLSQVIHKIAQLMIKFKAIIVLEDLSSGFMRGRQKVERQVYQKFEKMLIDKLNYLVDKDCQPSEAGGVLNAYQLTNDKSKLGKQSGCLFYIPAWNTSKIDPKTGFVNMLDTRYENVDKARCFFSKFDSIRYNPQKEWFEFTFDYNNFGTKAEGTQTKWTLCTYGTRIKTFRNQAKLNQWDNQEVVLTEEFKKIFQAADIDINDNLKDSICRLNEKQHLEPLMHLMKLLLQMRNSQTGTEIDYLLSPVADKDGHFYDSRTCSEDLPKDADANGAYNIARKGLWVIRQIKASKEGEKLNLAITNKEWLNFAQTKPYLKD